MPSTKRIAVIPGDGIGREVVPPAVELLTAAVGDPGALTFTEFDWGCDPTSRPAR